MRFDSEGGCIFGCRSQGKCASGRSVSRERPACAFGCGIVLFKYLVSEFKSFFGYFDFLFFKKARIATVPISPRTLPNMLPVSAFFAFLLLFVSRQFPHNPSLFVLGSSHLQFLQ